MDIPLTQLIPHPANPNRMAEETFAKLKGHIARTGRYEAIVVRPMRSEGSGFGVQGSGPTLDAGRPKPFPPTAVGGLCPTPDAQSAIRNPQSAIPRYQILNGHHRVEVLRQLGCETARCDVWDVDDAEALVLVATLNRLSGEDDPVKRDALLAELLKSFDAPQLADLVPESLEDLADLAQSLAPELPPDPAPPETFEPVEFLTFALSPPDCKAVEAALAATGRRDRAEALVAIARAYKN